MRPKRSVIIAFAIVAVALVIALSGYKKPDAEKQNSAGSALIQPTDIPPTPTASIIYKKRLVLTDLDTSGWLTFSDPYLSFRYPSSWQITVDTSYRSSVYGIASLTAFNPASPEVEGNGGMSLGHQEHLKIFIMSDTPETPKTLEDGVRSLTGFDPLETAQIHLKGRTDTAMMGGGEGDSGWYMMFHNKYYVFVRIPNNDPEEPVERAILSSMKAL